MTNRRSFLKGAGALSFLGGTGILSALGQHANAANVDGYKALVCLFFRGGQDSHDTVLPYDQASYDDYALARPEMLARYAKQAGGSTRSRERLLALSPTNSSQFGARQFALPETLAPLKTLFDSGNAAIVGNVGPLIEPLTRAQLEAESIPTPRRLFSHNDQQATWASLESEGKSIGWGGKFADAAIASGANQNELFTAISLAGNTAFLNAEQSQQYGLDYRGPSRIEGMINNRAYLLGTYADSDAALALLNEHYKNTGPQRANLFERDVATINKRAIESNAAFRTALETAQPLSTQFPSGGVANDLKAVAQTINVKNSLNVGRQVFFVSLGGFDTHSNQVTALANRHTQYAAAIAAFYESLVEMGAENDVTLFTASEFGRSLVENGDGTDHGWGGHHFVVGGGVTGNKIYGNIPPYAQGHDYDAGNGRTIPQVSVEQYAATLGKWFGLNNSELLSALPALANFTEKDLGFMSAPTA